jgi:hypothetical protein
MICGFEVMLRPIVAPAPGVHVPAEFGLQTPKVTEPPALKGNAVSVAEMFSVRSVPVTFEITIFGSFVKVPFATVPTIVGFAVELPPEFPINPEPMRPTVKVPVVAVGSDAGLIPVTIAPGAVTGTVTLIKVTVFWLPHVMLMVPVTGVPGIAAAQV